MANKKTQLIKNRINFLEDKIQNSNSIYKEIFQNELDFLQQLLPVKKIYVYDCINESNHEFSTNQMVYNFICHTIGYQFNYQSIARNKSRNYKIERRFFILNEPYEEFKAESDDIKEEYINERKNKNWFKKRTRIIPNRK